MKQQSIEIRLDCNDKAVAPPAKLTLEQSYSGLQGLVVLCFKLMPMGYVFDAHHATANAVGMRSGPPGFALAAKDC